MATATFTALLRRWPTACALRDDLKAHGCAVTDVLIRRWWNDEMLPNRHWRAFVAASEAKGFKDVSLDSLARIAEVPRKDRLAALAQGVAA